MERIMKAFIICDNGRRELHFAETIIQARQDNPDADFILAIDNHLRSLIKEAGDELWEEKHTEA